MALVSRPRNLALPSRLEEQVAIADEILVPTLNNALCKEIGPLVAEQTGRGRPINTGTPETPERRAAIPEFKSDAVEWYGGQSTLKRQEPPQRYLTRTVQNYIDGTLLYSENSRDDRAPDPYDDDAYRSAVIYVGRALAASASADDVPSRQAQPRVAMTKHIGTDAAPSDG
jgi:hypothetical protein